MSAVLNFDASQVAPDTGAQDAVPAGWYDVLMETSEMKPTKDTTGAYLECKFNIIAPAPFANKKIYTRLNLRNSNPTAQEIAYKQLSAICHATRVLQVSDSAQLHGIPLKVKVKLRKADGDYEASNEISAYKNINEVVAMAGAAVTMGSFPAPGAVAAPAPLTIPAQAPAYAPPQAPAYAPAPAAPVYAQAPQQPQAPQAPQWQPPAGQQPWQPPAGAPAQAPVMAPQQPQAPVYAPAPQQPQAPAQAPVYQQPQAPQPPQQQAYQPPAQAPAAAPNPAAAAQVATPPWMTPPAA